METNYKNYLYDNQDRYKYDAFDKYMLLKYWIIGFAVITLLYFLTCFACDDETIYVRRFSPFHRRLLRELTPAYPPPLVNFM